MRVDLHMHSQYSYDAGENSEISQICEAAVARKLDIIALTDHKDFFFTQPPVTLDIEAQRQEIAEHRERLQGQLKILSGVELGQIHAGAEAAAYAAKYDFDMVIGSLHVYRRNDTDMYFQNYETMDLHAFLADYFDELLLMVQQGGFDVLAHIDYPLRVMKLPGNAPTFAGFEDKIAPVLREIIAREIALELNAATLFGWKKAPGPERFILDMYRSFGGHMISIGSDSHTAADVGRGIDVVTAYAKQAGFSSVTVFEKRKPYQIAL